MFFHHSDKNSCKTSIIPKTFYFCKTSVLYDSGNNSFVTRVSVEVSD